MAPLEKKNSFLMELFSKRKMAFSFAPFRKYTLSNNALYHTIEVIWTSSNFLLKICLICVKVMVKQGDYVIMKENSARSPSQVMVVAV